MGYLDLLANNVLLRWLTGNRPRYELAVSMAGVRLGDRILQIGCADMRLVAALGAKVGYTGRACAVDADADLAQRAGQAAERAGVLVEARQAPLDRLPYDDGAFDLVVVRPDGSLAASLPALAPAFAEALRVLRPGGRCLIVADERSPRGAPAEAIRQLGSHGFRAARLLANREGLAFLEAVKAGA
jgi:ubiquinone/menaquinone biosynthesis C-methylase UbiE